MPSANHSSTFSTVRSRIWFLTLLAVLAILLSACGRAAAAQNLAPAGQAENTRPGAGADGQKAAQIKLSDVCQRPR